MNTKEIIDLLESQQIKKCSFENTESIPDHAGIYFAIDTSYRVFYVGMSANLKRRCDPVNHHKLPDAKLSGATHIAYVALDLKIEEIEDIEAELIDHFSPPLNGVKPIQTISVKVDKRMLLSLRTRAPNVEGDHSEFVNWLIQMALYGYLLMPKDREKPKRSEKGSVVVENVKGRLRLRWRLQGKQYSLGVGYPDQSHFRKFAEMLAAQIEEDILLNRFDPTLQKYKNRDQNS